MFIYYYANNHFLVFYLQLVARKNRKEGFKNDRTSTLKHEDKKNKAHTLKTRTTNTIINEQYIDI